MEMRQNPAGVGRAKFVSEEERPTHDLGTFGALQLLVLLVVSVAVSGWGASCSYSNANYPWGGATYPLESEGQCYPDKYHIVCVTGVGLPCGGCCGFTQATCNEWAATCQTQQDSTNCVNEGHYWDSQNDSCKTCSQNDTTWTEISCAYSSQRGQYLNVSNTYSIVNCETSTSTHQYYASKCDSAGADTAISCIGSVDGVHVMLRGSTGKVTTCAADGSCDMAIRKVAMGECENPNGPSPSSSASGESSSSEINSSDSGESSSSGEPESSASQDSTDWSWLRDSLGHIDYNIEFMQPFVTGIYDGVQEVNGNLYDMKENQRPNVLYWFRL